MAENQTQTTAAWAAAPAAMKFAAMGFPEVSGRPMIEYNQADMFQTACKYK
ncbi:hypothetical protein [Neisseria dentiae]|uniref:hypothetical protein n=1 Tax=Neisseria dentiae TaxID=194197 RepID=UPI00211CA1C1|nr:hypothetical protein [Neisseria dentiae]MCQ9326002.1 hypothetical protein [Neisseria dentiae]